MEILKCINLKKEIKGKTIINNISFSIKSGEIFGLIGPNGAGKTTIMKSIVGLIKLTEGEVYINDYSVKSNFIKAINKVGAIIETPNLYTYLSGYDNLKLASNNYKNITKSRINDVIKVVGLENRIKDKVSTYSLGMKQRLGIAEAILNEPLLLILDEPTNGLDIEGIIEIRNLIKTLSKNNISILISSHNLSEIVNLCNEIMILKNGKMISNVSTKDFIATPFSNIFILKLDKTNGLKNVLFENTFEILKDNRIRLLIEDKNELPNILKKLITNNYQIYSVEEKKLTLEEIFMKKVGENNID